jgi:hypothetical protein
MSSEITLELGDKIKKIAKMSLFLFFLQATAILCLFTEKPVFYKEIMAYSSLGCAITFFLLSKKHSAYWSLLENQQPITGQVKKEAWRRYFLAFAIPQAVSLIIFYLFLFANFK